MMIMKMIVIIVDGDAYCLHQPHEQPFALTYAKVVITLSRKFLFILSFRMRYILRMFNKKNRSNYSTRKVGILVHFIAHCACCVYVIPPKLTQTTFFKPLNFLFFALNNLAAFFEHPYDLPHSKVENELNSSRKFHSKGHNLFNK